MLGDLKIDETLVGALCRATREGLEMTGIVPDPIGAARHQNHAREVSVLVSLIGKQNGTVTINVSRTCAAYLAGRLLDEETYELDDERLDGLGEIGNMIAGRLKEILIDTVYAFEDISCPALILGANYNVYHYQGLLAASVEFEVDELPRICMGDRLFSVSIAMMRS